MDENKSLGQGDWEEDDFDRTISAFSGRRPKSQGTFSQGRMENVKQDQDLAGGRMAERAENQDRMAGTQGQGILAGNQESEEADEFDRTVSAFSSGRQGRGTSPQAGGPGNREQQVVNQGPGNRQTGHAPAAHASAASVPGKGIGARKPLALGWKIAGILGAILLLAAGLLFGGPVGFVVMAVLVLVVFLCVWGIRRAGRRKG